MKTVLEISNLNKSFPNFSLKDVSFKLHEGEIMGFIGPNGSGKTTTIKSILNIIYPDSGKILFWDKSIKSNQGTLDERIGIVMDQTFLLDTWTVRQSEKIIGKFYSNWSTSKFNGLIKQFHIADDKKIKELSKGMIMKLQIAIALSYDANMLILDEPTSGLDPVSRDELMDILKDFVSNGKNCVFFSTHITSDLEKVADTITFIENGIIKYTGRKEDLVSKYIEVSGNVSSLTKEIKEVLIGIKERSGLFSSLALKENSHVIPSELCKDATIDDIVIGFYKEDVDNE